MQIKSQVVRNVKQLTFLVMLIALVAGLIYTNQVVAHATLVKSDPPRRASLSLAPKHVQLWFNEEIEGKYATITVLDPNKDSVTDVLPETVPDDLKSVILPLPELEPGRYTVEYRVLSIDGHVVESAFGFMVKKK